MKLRSIIAMNLKYYRYQTGKTQEQFYENANLSYKYMSRIENGKINVTVDFVEDVSQKLNIKVIDLLNYDKNHLIKFKRIDAKKNKGND